MCEADSPSSRTSKTWTGEIHNEPFFKEKTNSSANRNIFLKDVSFIKHFQLQEPKDLKEKYFCSSVLFAGYCYDS